jgi:hypothetical protein
MSVSTLTTADTADVEIVQDLEPELLVFMAAIERAQPALGRLMAANYPGAERVVSTLLDIQGQGITQGELMNIQNALQEFTVGGGDQTALDHYRFCEVGRLTVGAAAQKILQEDDDEAHLDRVEALRHFAASRAGSPDTV